MARQRSRRGLCLRPCSRSRPASAATAGKEVRFGPRTIDLDVLLYGDLAISEPDLEIPHPRLLERAFVLVPLAEIAPDRLVNGIKVRDALARVGRKGIVLFAAPDAKP